MGRFHRQPWEQEKRWVVVVSSLGGAKMLMKRILMIQPGVVLAEIPSGWMFLLEQKYCC